MSDLLMNVTLARKSLQKKRQLRSKDLSLNFGSFISIDNDRSKTERNLRLKSQDKSLNSEVFIASPIPPRRFEFQESVNSPARLHSYKLDATGLLFGRISRFLNKHFLIWKKKTELLKNRELELFKKQAKKLKVNVGRVDKVREVVVPDFAGKIVRKSQDLGGKIVSKVPSNFLGLSDDDEPLIGSGHEARKSRNESYDERIKVNLADRGKKLQRYDLSNDKAAKKMEKILKKIFVRTGKSAFGLVKDVNRGEKVKRKMEKIQKIKESFCLGMPEEASSPSIIGSDSRRNSKLVFEGCIKNLKDFISDKRGKKGKDIGLNDLQDFSAPVRRICELLCRIMKRLAFESLYGCGKNSDSDSIVHEFVSVEKSLKSEKRLDSENSEDEFGEKSESIEKISIKVENYSKYSQKSPQILENAEKSPQILENVEKSPQKVGNIPKSPQKVENIPKSPQKVENRTKGSQNAEKILKNLAKNLNRDINYRLQACFQYWKMIIKSDQKNQEELTLCGVTIHNILLNLINCRTKYFFSNYKLALIKYKQQNQERFKNYSKAINRLTLCLRNYKLKPFLTWKYSISEPLQKSHKKNLFRLERSIKELTFHPLQQAFSSILIRAKHKTLILRTLNRLFLKSLKIFFQSFKSRLLSFMSNKNLFVGSSKSFSLNMKNFKLYLKSAPTKFSFKYLCRSLNRLRSNLTFHYISLKKNTMIKWKHFCSHQSKILSIKKKYDKEISDALATGLIFDKLNMLYITIIRSSFMKLRKVDN